MSVSTTRTASSVQGGYYTEMHIEFAKVKSPGLNRMVPILKGLEVEGKEGENPSAQSLVDSLRQRNVKVTTLPIEWKGKSQEELQGQLAVLRQHYAMQILLVRERTARRVLENDEFTRRSAINVANEYTMPLKQQLIRHWSKHHALKPVTGESMSEQYGGSRSTVSDNHTSAPIGGKLVKPPRLHESNVTKPPARLEVEHLKRSMVNFERSVNHVLASTHTPSATPRLVAGRSSIVVSNAPPRQLNTGTTLFGSAIRSMHPVNNGIVTEDDDDDEEEEEEHSGLDSEVGE